MVALNRVELIGSRGVGTTTVCRDGAHMRITGALAHFPTGITKSAPNPCSTPRTICMTAQTLQRHKKLQENARASQTHLKTQQTPSVLEPGGTEFWSCLQLFPSAGEIGYERARGLRAVRRARQLPDPPGRVQRRALPQRLPLYVRAASVERKVGRTLLTPLLPFPFSN